MPPSLTLKLISPHKKHPSQHELSFPVPRMATLCRKAHCDLSRCSNCFIANNQHTCQDILAGTKLPRFGGKQQSCARGCCSNWHHASCTLLDVTLAGHWPPAAEQVKSNPQLTLLSWDLHVSMHLLAMNTMYPPVKQQNVCPAAETVPYTCLKHPCAGHMQRLLKGC